MSDDTILPALSVLLVEDQPDIAESLKMVLTLYGGYAVSIAADGQQGIDMALANPPDAVICDIGLPKKNGFEVGTELSRRLPKKPLLIAISGYSWENSARRAVDAGFNHFLVKPADPEKLDTLLKTYQATKGSQAATVPHSDSTA